MLKYLCQVRLHISTFGFICSNLFYLFPNDDTQLQTAQCLSAPLHTTWLSFDVILGLRVHWEFRFTALGYFSPYFEWRRQCAACVYCSVIIAVSAVVNDVFVPGQECPLMVREAVTWGSQIQCALPAHYFSIPSSTARNKRENYRQRAKDVIRFRQEEQKSGIKGREREVSCFYFVSVTFDPALTRSTPQEPSLAQRRIRWWLRWQNRPRASCSPLHHSPGSRRDGGKEEMDWSDGWREGRRWDVRGEVEWRWQRDTGIM